MCTNGSTTICSENSVLPYGVSMTDSKLAIVGTEVSVPDTGVAPAMVNSMMQPLDHYRLHLYNYALQAERLRFVQNYGPIANPMCPTLTPYGPRWAFPMTLLQHRLQPDEPKPQHSYIGLIAMAILRSPECKLVLSDIYQYILDNYPYFRSRGPGWRNSIRHNLSLNDCFVKAGRSANGKGHYWAIHPANIEDFRKGDFRRRKAQRKVRKHMGLAVDDDGNDSPSPPPMTPPPPTSLWSNNPLIFPAFPTNISRKRQFDMASLLAPDDSPVNTKRHFPSRPSSSSEDCEESADIDVVTGPDPSFSNNNNDKNPQMTNLNDGSCRPISPNSNSTGPVPSSPWRYSMGILQTTTPSLEQQQFVARYYEQLSQARTIQIYQQWQLQRTISTEPSPDESNK